MHKMARVLKRFRRDSVRTEQPSSSSSFFAWDPGSWSSQGEAADKPDQNSQQQSKSDTHSQHELTFNTQDITREEDNPEEADEDGESEEEVEDGEDEEELAPAQTVRKVPFIKDARQDITASPALGSPPRLFESPTVSSGRTVTKSHLSQEPTFSPILPPSEDTATPSLTANQPAATSTAMQSNSGSNEEENGSEQNERGATNSDQEVGMLDSIHDQEHHRIDDLYAKLNEDEIVDEPQDEDPLLNFLSTKKKRSTKTMSQPNAIHSRSSGSMKKSSQASALTHPSSPPERTRKRRWSASSADEEDQQKPMKPSKRQTIRNTGESVGQSSNAKEPASTEPNDSEDMALEDRSHDKEREGEAEVEGREQEEEELLAEVELPVVVQKEYAKHTTEKQRGTVDVEQVNDSTESEEDSSDDRDSEAEHRETGDSANAEAEVPEIDCYGPQDVLIEGHKQKPAQASESESEVSSLDDEYVPSESPSQIDEPKGARRRVSKLTQKKIRRRASTGTNVIKDSEARSLKSNEKKRSKRNSMPKKMNADEGRITTKAKIIEKRKLLRTEGSQKPSRGSKVDGMSIENKKRTQQQAASGDAVASKTKQAQVDQDGSWLTHTAAKLSKATNGIRRSWCDRKSPCQICANFIAGLNQGKKNGSQKRACVKRPR